jgi:hypothetical protein
VADGAQLARNGWAALTADTQAAAQQASTGTAAFESMSTALQEVGTAAASAGQQTRAELTATAATAQATAAEVAGAFERMGIQSKDQLAQAAANAQRDFQLIKASGQATTEGLQTAFKAYAQAAIAANNGVATEALRSQAAMQGLEVAADAAGKTVVRAFADGEQVTAGLTRGVREATAAVQEYVGWLDRMEKRNAEVKSSLQKDSEGFATNTAGGRVVAGGNLTTLTGISKFLQEAGLNEEQARSTAREFADSQGNVQYFNNPGQIKYGGRASTISEALLKAAERVTFGTGGGPSGAIGVGRTVRVEINTPRGSEIVNTDEEGAAATVRALQLAGLSARG